MFSEDESEDADEVYEEFDAELDLEDVDWNDFDDDDEWEEYDRNICALSGGSPSGELHFYVSNEPSEVGQLILVVPLFITLSSPKLLRLDLLNS